MSFIYTALKLLQRYWRPLAVSLFLVGVYLYAHDAGYDKAENKFKLERAAAIEAELIKIKTIEKQLQTEREKNYELDRLYDEAVKSDANYNCIVPDSLRHYINTL